MNTGPLAERWKEISCGAIKLFVWLTIPPRHGHAEASFATIGLENGMSLKMIRCAVKELEGLSLIAVERSKGKNTKTRIRTISISPAVQGADSFYRPVRIMSGLIDAPQVSRSGPAMKSAQPTHCVQGADVQQRNNGVPTDAPTGSGSPTSKPKPDRNIFAGELSTVARMTLAYIRFEPDKRSLSRGFVSVLEWVGKRNHLPLPGVLASLVINRCLFQQRTRKAAGKDPSLYLFPNGLQKHRDTLRRHERRAAEAARVAA